MFLLAQLEPWMAILRGALRICNLMALKKLCGTALFGYFFLLLRKSDSPSRRNRSMRKKQQ